MKKLLMILALGLSTLLADVSWKPNLTEAVNAAAKENKPLMILMSTTHCRYCKQMHREVFANKAVADYLNTRFVSVEIDVENDAYPEALNVQGVPAVFFFSPDLKTRYQKILGPRHPMMFMQVLQEISPAN